MAEGVKSSANRGHSKICQDLKCVTALPSFGDTKLLLAMVAESGGNPGQGEDGDQRGKGADAPSHIENKAADRSCHGARVGDAT